MNEEGQRIVLEEMVEEFKKKKHAMFEELKNKISEVEINNKLKEEVEKLLIEELKKLIMRKNEELKKVTKEKDEDLKKVTQEMNEKLEKVVKEKNEELKKVMNEMNEKLEEERFELEVKEDTCEALVIKEGQSNVEIQEAHKELIRVLRDLSGDRSSTIGVKRIGEIDEKPFSKVCKQRFSGENVELENLMLYSKWQDTVKDPAWHPFKLVGAGEKIKEVVDEEDEKLKNLREEWGEEVKNAVKTALVELNEFNPSGRYSIPVVWNFRQERKATLKEGIAHMAEKIKALKRKARMSDLRVLMPGIDRISELPEYLITKILLCLPTKESVKTSVLSTRWKNLWLKVPGLDLNCHDFPYEDYEQVEFTNFIDRFLEFNNQLRLQKFKVNYSRHEILGFKDRIGTAINRGIQILDAMGSSSYRRKDDGFMYIEFMPLNLFTSKTLVSLKLFFSGLEDPGFVSMPCLKFMSLWKIRWCGTMTLEKLVSGCPVLEELILIRDIDEDESVVTPVRSQSLKTFYVPSAYGILCRSRVPHTLLEIDAPGLEYLTLKEDHYDRIVVKNLTSLFMIDLNIKFIVKHGTSFDPEDSSKRNEICDFLNGISSARHMIISQKTVEALDLYSKVGSIPKFKNLSRLQAAFPRPLLQFLPTFLESFPNLKHLILKIAFAKDDKMEELKLVNVPQSFVSTLECVEIKKLLQWEEEHMKLASYFLENSSVLKKLIVSFIDYPRYASKSDVYEDLDKLTKRSPRCQIIVIVDDD